MRILAYEHVTGGGMLDDPRMPAWAPEGDAMLRELTADLRLVADVEVVVLRDPRLPADIPGVEFAPVSAGAFRSSLRAAILGCDAVWPIAPETDGILLDLTNEILDGGRALLNSRPDAVRIASSKRATHEVLERNGIPSIGCHATEDALPAATEGVVVKPDDGAGCLDTLLFRDRPALRRWLQGHPGANCVLQPYVAGEARSLSLLCHGGQGRLLAINRQRIVIDGEAIRFEGVDVAAVEDDGSCAGLTDRICKAMPGLWGYCGVDVIETSRGPVVVEINPRLTLSYVGLRRATGLNAAALVVDLLRTANAPERSRALREPAAGAGHAR